MVQKESNVFNDLKAVTLALFLILIAFVFTLMLIQYAQNNNLNQTNQNQTELPALTNNNPTDYSFDKEIIQTLEDGTKYIIHPDKIESGGPPKGGIGNEGGIPSLDKSNINFVNKIQANEWIKDEELIIKLDYNGETRIYPFQILVFHEIVNDEINGEPVLITYCPLCGTSIAYKREIMDKNFQKQTVKFGVSGKLHNSNLIMYDDLTNTYWQQIEGKAILGELTGQVLQPIETNTLTWREFKKSQDYQNDNENIIKILSKETGFNRPYGNDPYPNYAETSYLLFPPKNIDRRIELKKIIYGIEINNQFKAYEHEKIIENIKNNDIIYDIVNNTKIKIENNDGEITFTNENLNQIIPKERGMWFSWYAFHPTTLLWEPNNK